MKNTLKYGVAFLLGFFVCLLVRTSPMEKTSLASSSETRDLTPNEIAAREVNERAVEAAQGRGGEIVWNDVFEKLGVTTSAGERKALEAEMLAMLEGMTVGEKLDFLRYGYDYPDRASIRGFMWEVARHLGRMHPTDAKSMFRELTIDQRREFMRPMVQGLAMGDPGEAWDWMMSIGGTEEGRFVDRNARNQLVYSALFSISRMSGDPVKALEMALKYPDPNYRSFLAEQTAGWIVDGSPESALGGLDLNEESDKYVLEAVMKKWARASPMSAKAWIMEHDGSVSDATVQTVASNLASQVGPESMRDLYAATTNPYQKDIIAKEAARWAGKEDVESALEWMESVGDSRLYARTAGGVLYEWGAEVPLARHVDFIERAFERDPVNREDLLRTTVKLFSHDHQDQIDAYFERLIEEDPTTLMKLRE